LAREALALVAFVRVEPLAEAVFLRATLVRGLALPEDVLLTGGI
jgi:hypothetical protein